MFYLENLIIAFLSPRDCRYLKELSLNNINSTGVD